MKIGDIISLLRLIAYVVFEVLKAVQAKHKNNRQPIRYRKTVIHR